MSLYGSFKGVGPSGFGYSSTAEQVTEGLDLSGRTYLITGCNSGIGEETARVLLLRGARVVGLARTEEKAASALRPMGGDWIPVACELSEPDAVRAAVDAVQALGLPLDALIANAGIMALPERQVKHGHELQFLTNHLGHSLLVLGLLDRLAEDGRVVMLTSSAHRRAPPEGIRFDDPSFEHGYQPWLAYGQSKLANMLFAKNLATRLPKPDQRALSVHPGVIYTKLSRHMSVVVRPVMTVADWLVLKSVGEGAATQAWAAVHPEPARHNGAFLADCNLAQPSANGRDAALAERLWQATEGWLAAL